jgi:hypothetical protein
VRFTRLTLSVLFSVGLSTVVHAGPIGVLTNGDFESGLDGWTAEIESYDSFLYGLTPAGTITATDALFNIRETTDGGLMALMGSQDTPTYTGEGAPWDIVLHQTIALEAGSSLAGSVFFYNGDYIAQEQAWIQIRDANGNLVATPWKAWSGMSGQSGVIAGEAYDPPPVGWQEATAWTTWNWEAAVAGEYTLALGLTTRGDNTWATYVGHDRIHVAGAENLVTASQVVEAPEPSTLLLLAVALSAMWYRRHSTTIWQRR